MAESSPTKLTLKANVFALMGREYGGENLTRLARETGIGPGSATRIKEAETSVGIDTLEKLAERFQIEPWQLLAPDLGASLHQLREKTLVPVYAPPKDQHVPRLDEGAPRPGLRYAEGQKRRGRKKIGRDAA